MMDDDEKAEFYKGLMSA